MITTTARSNTDWGPEGDIDLDSIPNVLDVVALTLGAGASKWHNNLSVLCKSSSFNARRCAWRFCLSVMKENWGNPLPDFAAEIASLIERYLSGESTTTDLLSVRTRVQSTYPDLMDNRRCAFSAACIGLPDFTAIGVINHQTQGRQRSSAIHRMRILLQEAVKFEQGV